MQTIKQIFAKYLAEQKGKLASRTFKYHEEALGWLEHSINGYAHLCLTDEKAKKFEENYDKGIEFCETFGPEEMDEADFSEFLGYFYPKKVASGHDTARKICGATCNFYKWGVRNKYIAQEADGDEIDEVELHEAVNYLRNCFHEGWEEFNNFEENYN